MGLSKIEFSEDENQVILGGHTYVAVPQDDGRCGECVFKLKFGCDLAEAVYRRGLGDPKGPRCRDSQREDGKGVIWRLAVKR